MKFVTLKEQEGWYTLTEVLTWLRHTKQKTRYQVNINVINDLLVTSGKKEAYEKLGCGRRSFGVGEYCLTCSKEVWPPEFWIGHC